MNIGLIACLAFAAIFGIMGLVFALLKEKGAMLVSGFNTLPKAKREQYDKKKISSDQRNMLFLWTVIMLLGAVLSYFITEYMAVIAFLVWIVFFFREVHVDEEKAFGKYKK